MSVPAQDDIGELDRGLELEPEAARPRSSRRVDPAAARRSLLAIVVVFFVWEGVKFLGGTPWRAPGAVPGSGAPILWNPPFRWPFANDLTLPHVWNIVLVMGQPFQRGADQSVIQYLFVAALYTWREAFIGFVLGSRARPRRSRRRSSTRGSPSGPSCRTSSRARRSRSSPSRR